MKQKLILFVESKEFFHDSSKTTDSFPHWKPGTYMIEKHSADKITIKVKLLNGEIFPFVLTAQDDASFIAEKNFNKDHYEKFKILGLDKASKDINYFITRLGGCAGLSSVDLKPKKNEFNDDRIYIALAIASLEFAQKPQNTLTLSPLVTPNTKWTWTPKISKLSRNNRSVYLIDAYSNVNSHNLSFRNKPEFTVDANGIIPLFNESSNTLSISDYKQAVSQNFCLTGDKIKNHHACQVIFSALNSVDNDFIGDCLGAEELYIYQDEAKAPHLTRLRTNSYFHKDISSTSQAQQLLSDDLYTPGSYLFYEKDDSFILAIKFFHEDAAPAIFELVIEMKLDGSLEFSKEKNPQFDQFKFLGIINAKKITDLAYFVNKFGGITGIKFSDKSMEETGDRNINPIRLLFATLELVTSKKNSVITIKSMQNNVSDAYATIAVPTNLNKGRTYTVHNPKEKKEVGVIGYENGLPENELREANKLFLPIAQHLLAKQGKQEQNVSAKKVSNNNEIKIASANSLPDGVSKISSDEAKKILLDENFNHPEGTYILNWDYANANLVTFSVITMTRDIFQIGLKRDPSTGLYAVDLSKFDAEKNQSKLVHLGLLISGQDLNYYIIRCGGLQKLEYKNDQAYLVTEKLNISSRNLLALHILSFEFFAKEEDGVKKLKFVTKDNIKIDLVYKDALYSYESADVKYRLPYADTDPKTKIAILLMDSATKAIYLKDADKWTKIACQDAILLNDAKEFNNLFEGGKLFVPQEIKEDIDNDMECAFYDDFEDDDIVSRNTGNNIYSDARLAARLSERQQSDSPARNINSNGSVSPARIIPSDSARSANRESRVPEGFQSSRNSNSNFFAESRIPREAKFSADDEDMLEERLEARKLPEDISSESRNNGPKK